MCAVDEVAYYSLIVFLADKDDVTLFNHDIVGQTLKYCHMSFGQTDETVVAVVENGFGVVDQCIAG